MNDAPHKPFWVQNPHLTAGVIVVIGAVLAVTGLQRASVNERRAANAVVSLALDMGDAIATDAPPVTSAALHQHLLAAIDRLDASADTAAARLGLGRHGPAGLDTESAALADYEASLRLLIRAVDTDARVTGIRIQQIQMGVVAGAAIMLILLIRNVAANREAEPRSRRIRLAHSSQIDPLTGLGRLDATREQLGRLLDNNKPSPGFVGLLAVGIQPEHEHFLALTRAQLDAALVETVRRLRVTVRATDTICRLSRNELAVALPATPRVEDPGRVASKVLGALDAPITIDDVVVRPNPRVGVAIAPLDAVTPDGLIQRARLARRAASDAPAPVYRSYRDGLAPAELGTLQMIDDLRAALDVDDGQLWVAYQPKIDLRSENVAGFEALARWDHPHLGNIAPVDFIGAAEESDLILDLGAWVLDKVCAQLAAWRRHMAQPVPVSVNVSGRQFETPGLAAVVRATLQRHAIPATLLELELTERILLADRPDLIATMDELRDMGVRLAVDDFGTGYSALSYLKRFPIDVIKIDRSFIREIHDDNGDEAISTAIISMAHSMSLQVVAEGVETPEQLTVLRGLDCDAAQGFYFAHPASPSEIETRV